MEITKNRQSEEVLRKMALRAFPGKQMEEAVELTEGMCNTAYLVSFTDKSRYILKIAAAGNRGRMSNEANLMEAEVRAMQIVHKTGAVKAAKVLYYDTSNEICDGHYFFMEKLEGQSCSSVMDSFSDEEKAVIHFEIGQAEREITSILGVHFGLLGDDSHYYQDLFSFVYQLISNVLSDAKRKQVDIVVSAEKILEMLKRDGAVFGQVTQPVLVHWDMWEGNIFVKEKHVSGIIDWERAMWGEALMDDRFRRHTRNADFLKGFGKETFTEAEMRRIYWYDILLYLTMMTEGAYREYEDDGVYQWAKRMLEISWKEIVGRGLSI